MCGCIGNLKLMERYVFSDLIDWVIRERRKPLLLRGARQVGKTWMVEKLAHDKFEFYLKVDFEENQELISLLEVHASDKKFKNLFLDIGLMNRVMGIDYNEALRHKNLLSVYRGQLAEQFVGQEFGSATNNQLYYWARDAKNSNAEIDYLVVLEGQIYPVEVKDGPSGKLRSLHLYRETYQPSYSVVFHAGTQGILENEKIVFLPLYFAGAFAKYGFKFD